MSFFEETPTLLTSDQLTFIGVIATLAVLSVIPNRGRKRRSGLNKGSNLLVDLIAVFIESVDKYLTGAGKERFEEEIENIKTKVLEKNEIIRGYIDQYGVLSLSLRLNLKKIKVLSKMALKGEQVKVMGVRLNLEEKKRRIEAEVELGKLKKNTYIEKNTPVFMSFFTFILCVAVMTIHFLHFNEIVNALFLFLLDIFYTIVLLSSWMVYRHDWLIRDKQISLVFEDTSFWRGDTLPFIIITFAVALIVLGNLLETIVLSIIIVVAKVFFFHIRKKNEYEHYNLGTLALFAVVGIFFAAIIPLMIQYLLIYCVWDSQCLFWIIGERIECWRVAFICLCVINTFILPLLISYYRYEVRITRQLNAIIKLYRRGLRKANRANRKIKRKLEKIESESYLEDEKKNREVQRKINEAINRKRLNGTQENTKIGSFVPDEKKSKDNNEEEKKHKSNLCKKKKKMRKKLKRKGK